MTSKIIGIDLETANSCMSVMDGGECRVITNPEGNRTTPFAVAYKNGERIVGDAAERQVVTNKNITDLTERLMGINEEVGLESKQYTSQEVSAMILQYLKSYVEDYLGEKIEEAVITIPAYFNDSQCQVTKDVGRIAGPEVERITDEPTAVVPAYGTDKTEKEQRVLIYDLGGGAFDASILELADGIFEVLSTSGDTKLGGDDFDSVAIDWMVDTSKKENRVDPCKDTMVMQHLKGAGEKAKKDLGGVVQTQVFPSFVSTGADGPLYFEAALICTKSDEMTRPLVEHTVEPIRNTLCDAGPIKNDVHQVLLIDGSTHIPAVQEAVKSALGKEPNKPVNPDEIVATGAAVQGGVITDDIKDVPLLDVIPLSLGIETIGSVMTVLTPHNTTIPTNKSQVLSTAAGSQPAVDIRVLRGERPMANDNKKLSMFKLDGIAPTRHGIPQIEATFDIDVNGIVYVSARDKGTGKEQSVTIRNTSGLSGEEIDRTAREAEKHKAGDEERKEEIGLHNYAEGFITQTDSVLADNGDKIDAKQKEEIQRLRDDLQKSLDENDMNTVEERLEALGKVAQAVSAQMYQQQSANPNTGVGVNNANSDDNTVDAGFEKKE